MPRQPFVDERIVGIQQIEASPLRVKAEIRYTFVGGNKEAGEQRMGTWQTEWLQHAEGDWRVTRWIATEETLSSAKTPFFAETTAQAFGGIDSYREQMLRGADHWRTVLDGASGIDVLAVQSSIRLRPGHFTENVSAHIRKGAVGKQRPMLT